MGIILKISTWIRAMKCNQFVAKWNRQRTTWAWFSLQEKYRINL